MQAKQQQSGFALLIFVLMMIGMGGVALTGYAQKTLKQVEGKKFLHNKEVLEQAKQALLMYAYRYPQFNSEGPGRLPCPYDQVNGYSGPLSNAICDSVGRLPVNDPDLNFFDARDSSNEQLWYAVSDNFHNLGGGPVINSNSVGSITLVSQNQSVIYDGAVSGIAAVIIAPGPAINGQNRTAAPTNPANYLDSFNGFDNSAFNNGESNTNDDGFILGPVFDSNTNTVVINDEMVVITTEEIIDMAEKGMLDVYKSAIDEYQQNIWGANVANYRYPWLDDYTTLAEYDADINTIIGRVPSVFENYYNGNAIGDFASDTKFVMIPQPGAHSPEHQIEYSPPSAVADVSFDVNGNLLTSLNSSAVSITRYFWDGHPTNTDINSPIDGVFELCTGTAGLDTGDAEDNCNRTAAGAFKTDDGIYTVGDDDTSDVWLQVYELTITFDSGANPFTLPDANLTSGGPSGRYLPPNSAENAYIFGTYNNNGGVYTVNWVYDLDFRSDHDDMGSGALNSIDVGVVYYPEIGDWVLGNDWQNSIQMAVAADYQPGGAGDCIANAPCLTVNNLGGINNNKVALLSIAGDVLDPTDDAPAGYADDIAEIFEVENSDLDTVFARRAGDDKVLILREQ